MQHNARIQIRAAVMEIADVTYEDSGMYVCMLRGTKEALRNFTITVTGRICNMVTFKQICSLHFKCSGNNLNAYCFFADAVGSGDDDEDNGLDDAGPETENDQVYISRG